jgi:tetratricopeptide (TPR) repeat protein
MIMMRLHEDKEKRDWTPVDKMLDEIEHQWSMTPNLAVLKAEVLLAKDSPEEAQKLLEHCSADFPKSAQLWLALIRLPIYLADKAMDPIEKEKEWKQASDYIDRAEQNLGDQAMLRSTRGSLAILRKGPQQVAVLKKLGENLDKMTDVEKTQLWSNLGTLSVQANDLDSARSYFRLVAEKDPKNISVRCFLCELNLRLYEKGQTPDLQELDKRLGEIEQLGGRGPNWLYAKAIRTLVQSNEKDPELLLEARGYLQDALEVRRNWSAPAVLAGKICELQKEPDQALDFYIRAIYQMGERDNDVIRRTVKLLLPRRHVVEAKQLFDYLEKQKSPLLAEMNQDYVYVKVFTKVFTGDIAEAAKEVEKSVAADSQKYEEFLHQGQFYGVLAGRLALMAQAAKRDWTTDPEVIQMAQRAVNSLSKACSANPRADEVWIAIIKLLVDVGQADRARPLIADAERSLKGEETPITLAICWELLNEAAKAQADEAAQAVRVAQAEEGTTNAAPQNSERQRQLATFREEKAQLAKHQAQLAASYAANAQVKYEEAAKAYPQKTRVLRQVAAFYLKIHKADQAELLLNKIISLQSPATLTDVCWARRNLALILKSRGDFDHFCQGMALIDENLRSKAASIEDKRERVYFLIVDPRKEKIGEAIQAMEELVKGTDATPEDNLDLAKLYLKKGDWDNYSKRMHSVLGAQKGVVPPAILVFYITTLLEKKELDDADNWLRTLEKTAPNLFDTVRLRAEYQFLRGTTTKKATEASVFYKAAGDLAMAFLDNPDAQPKDRGQQLLLVAQVMEGFGDRLKAEGKRVVAKEFGDKAETLFESQRSKTVSQAGDIYYAAYLARQKRVRECLELLELCSGKYPPERLYSTAFILVHSKAANADQYQQLEQILVAANKSNSVIPLLLVLADLHTQQGQYDKSIADCREILAKDPRNYPALNNLGIGLARSALGIDPARSAQILDEALKLVNDALAISGPMAEVLDSRAVVHIARQEFEQALEDLAAAIKDDGAAEQYFHQAWAYLLAGKKTEASAAFAQAMKKGLDRKDLDPREGPVFDSLQGL